MLGSFQSSERVQMTAGMNGMNGTSGAGGAHRHGADDLAPATDGAPGAPGTEAGADTGTRLEFASVGMEDTERNPNSQGPADAAFAEGGAGIGPDPAATDLGGVEGGAGSPSGALRRIVKGLAWLRGDDGHLDFVLAEQFNRLRHAVCYHPHISNVRSILVTSAVDSEGKSTIATGLACAFARSLDHWALLVEADLRRPTISTRFGLSPEPGLAEHIVEGRPLAAAIRATQIPKLSVLCAGGRAVQAANVLASAHMKRVAEEVRNRYSDRVIIYDAPPVVPTPEPLSLSLLVDGIIIVVEAGHTPRALVQQALRALPREKILGVVLNRLALGRGERRYYGSYYGFYGGTPATSGTPPTGAGAEEPRK
jgi:capsular exopolysaccharide synthesis family protein